MYQQSMFLDIKISPIKISIFDAEKNALYIVWASVCNELVTVISIIQYFGAYM